MGSKPVNHELGTGFVTLRCPECAAENKPPVVVTAPIPEHLRERLKMCGWNEG